MTKQERFNRYFENMARYGITYEDAAKLRRIEMTLQRWAELECGNDNGHVNYAIERDEQTEKPYMVYHPHSGAASHRHRIADREAGALRRLDRIMSAYPALVTYHQTDPRGCALYIIRKSDLPRDYFKIVKVEGGWSIQRTTGNDKPYSGASKTKVQAKEFAFRETLNCFYTRGLAVCV